MWVVEPVVFELWRDLDKRLCFSWSR